MKPIREVNEERDSQYPAYRRWDVNKWAKWKFYPGAILLLPLKFVMVVMVLLVLYVIVRIVTIGHDFSKDDPIRGWFRNRVLGYVYTVCGHLILFFMGLRSSYDVRDYDYSYFLGPNYKETTT
jgi:hypothetical protein